VRFGLWFLIVFRSLFWLGLCRGAVWRIGLFLGRLSMFVGLCGRRIALRLRFLGAVGGLVVRLVWCER